MNEVNRVSVFFIFCALLSIVPSVYIINMGGEGLSLPQNNISVMLVCIIVTYFCYYFKNNCCLLTYDQTIILLLVAVTILIIPILYTRSEWSTNALWYWCGIFSGFIFYFFVTQIDWSSSRWWIYSLYTILAMVTLQVIFSLFQLLSLMDWIPYPKISWRPYGVFQQVNVLSSFVATGTALISSMILLPEFKLTSRSIELFRKYLLMFLLFLFSFITYSLKSRIGFIGCVISLAFIYIFFSHENKKLANISVAVVILGFAVSIFFEKNEIIGSRDSSSSTFARVEILKSTWDMIKQKSLLGWGAGGFEFSFQHFRLSNGNSTESLGIISHPHNEFLFWWVENGVFGLVSFIMICIFGVMLFYNGVKDWKFNAKNNTLMLVLVTIPVILHSQTEYVFRLSFLHWYLTIFLLAVSNNVCTSKQNSQAWRILSPTLTKCIYELSVFCFSLIFVIMCYSLYGVKVLSNVEKSKFTDVDGFYTMSLVSKLIHSDRYSFDSNMISLLEFNQTEDERLLDGYVDWAMQYLKTNIDKSVYFNLVNILQFKGRSYEASLYDRDAKALFPQNHDPEENSFN